MTRRVLLLVIGAGLALGIASRLVDHVAPRWVGDAAAVWVLVAFWAGRRASSVRAGATLGFGCLVSACLAYYAWRVWVDGDLWPFFLMSVGAFWVGSSVVAGSVAGYLGVRSQSDPAFWGAVAGAFIGEALAVALLRGAWLQASLEVTVGVFLLVRGRPRLRSVAVVALAAAVTVAGLGIGYRTLLGTLRMARRFERLSTPQLEEGPPRSDGPSSPAILRR